MKLLLEATIHAREGALQQAALLLDQAEDSRPHVKGTCDGTPFADFRDLDDQLSCVLEVLTSRGITTGFPFPGSSRSSSTSHPGHATCTGGAHT